MRYKELPADLFRRHRKRLAEKMDSGGVAVLHSADVPPKSADGVRRFVQQTDLFYLSGIDQEETILLLCPEAADEKHREILFLRRTSPEIKVWEGHKLSQEEARKRSGIRTVMWTDRFEDVFRTLACESRCIYLNANEHLRADLTVETRDDRFIADCRRRFPLHRYERLGPLLHELRAVKDPEEVDAVRKACEITGRAFRRLLGFIRPGVMEYEIEAEIWHEFIRSGSRGPGFEPIMASGENACVLHYVKNDRPCQDGDLVLMDFGAEYGNYNADITRTVPVNGRFTDRQRQVYEAVQRVHDFAVGLLRPGNVLKTCQEEVGRRVDEELVGLGLLTAAEIADQNPENPLRRKWFMHGVSHHLGLDVHDYGDRRRPFAPGMILTCEPGIYIRDEGIGIRLENDILITDGEAVNLTADLPVDPGEIEALMSAGRQGRGAFYGRRRSAGRG